MINLYKTQLIQLINPLRLTGVYSRRIKFVCIAMCSLVMSLCSRDLHMKSLNNITIAVD